MSTSLVAGLASGFVESIVGKGLSLLTKGSGSTSGTTGTSASTLGTADSGTLSPFASLINQLQQLQQSDPSKYQQVTKQIATNLQTAGQTAQTQGNTAAASRLNQLASDFSSASASGQLPSLQDLAQSVGSGHHHHHHASGSSTSTAAQTLTQTASLFSPTAVASTVDPSSIIFSTLNSAGVTA